MNGTITHQFGRAFTGQGEKNIYNELINEARKVYFIKSPPTFKLSDLFRQVGYHYVKRGYDIEWFYDSLHVDVIEATYVKSNRTLFIQASHPVSFEPKYYGSTHHVISFYEAYDEQKLREHGGFLREKTLHSEQWLGKALQTLTNAKNIHDEWEVPYVSGMDWTGFDAQAESLFNDTFTTLKFNKPSHRTHRLMGTLTPEGPKDYFDSLTKRFKRRIFIKGYPGSGKSTLMKRFGEHAEGLGLDTQWGWCGLDCNSIDYVWLPELQTILFDSTSPHEYEPDRSGDEIFDVKKFRDLNDEEGLLVEGIITRYKEEIVHATEYLQVYCTDDETIRETLDTCVNNYKWQEIEIDLFQKIDNSSVFK
ncbi:hypothetical protein [Paenisporosarcina sp. OV554]|uniref:hypothetical protein n=1 Tax=Paenisporosarcina sp. OV554 TaxID=2135694 RepID=UPI000D3A7B01|nr:hypothetical protein [Paenisporosarcina sp. OV554]PUB02963.1 hypothetical protein C8K15_1592 [Paenisporosarcina sp. OV554]